MSEATLKCPHCGNPVGFSPTVAGRVVACPHCRGQFQMPVSPPVSSAPPQSTKTKPRTDPIPEKELGFRAEPLPSSGGSKAVERISKVELGSYRAATALANGIAVIGTFAVMLTGIMVAMIVVMPMFKENDGQPRSLALAVISMVSVFVFAFMAVMALFLIRACVLVGVDAARTLRAVEREFSSPR